MQIQGSNPNFYTSTSSDLNDEEERFSSLQDCNYRPSATLSLKRSSARGFINRSSSICDPSYPVSSTYASVSNSAINLRSNSIITQLEKSKLLQNMSDPKRPLTILHYNDVYNVESNSSVEPVGGAARFCTAIKSLADENPLILFSGDIFSPSMRKYHKYKFFSKTY